MFRIAAVSVVTAGLLAAIAAGCQGTSGSRVSRTDNSQFWSANGGNARTLVSGQSGNKEVRLASLRKKQGSSGFTGLLGSDRAERIPLPRSDGDGFRQIDTPARDSSQAIGAF